MNKNMHKNRKCHEKDINMNKNMKIKNINLHIWYTRIKGTIV